MRCVLGSKVCELARIASRANLDICSAFASTVLLYSDLAALNTPLEFRFRHVHIHPRASALAKYRRSGHIETELRVARETSSPGIRAAENRLRRKGCRGRPFCRLRNGALGSLQRPSR